jgi:hypothetical protein
VLKGIGIGDFPERTNPIEPPRWQSYGSFPVGGGSVYCRGRGIVELHELTALVVYLDKF